MIESILLFITVIFIPCLMIGLAIWSYHDLRNPTENELRGK